MTASTKQHVLAEIRRTARANGGRALGRLRFEQETGIRYTEWYGRYWKRWSDAVVEAGLAPNQMQGRLDDDHLLSRYAGLVRACAAVPTSGDLLLKRRDDPTFPSRKVFDRFGSKSRLVARARDFCRDRAEWRDVFQVLSTVVPESQEFADRGAPAAPTGFVYLVRSGRYHKIGYTNSIGRREYELGIQLPEAVEVIHQIETDDPEGIEAYWHNRFAEKRARGEWFKLTPADVAAFKRRRFQ